MNGHAWQLQTARAVATGDKGLLRLGEGRTPKWLPMGTLQPQDLASDSHVNCGQKDNKSYFSCKYRVGHQENQSPLYDMPNC